MHLVMTTSSTVISLYMQLDEFLIVIILLFWQDTLDAAPTAETVGAFEQKNSALQALRLYGVQARAQESVQVEVENHYL